MYSFVNARFRKVRDAGPSTADATTRSTNGLIATPASTAKRSMSKSLSGAAMAAG